MNAAEELRLDEADEGLARSQKVAAHRGAKLDWRECDGQVILGRLRLRPIGLELR